MYSEWNVFPYFQTMVQVIGALTGCVQHVCATQESVILENIQSLPSSVLHVIKSTFEHCKVSAGSKYNLIGLESMGKGPSKRVLCLRFHILACVIGVDFAIELRTWFYRSGYKEVIKGGFLPFICLFYPVSSL